MSKPVFSIIVPIYNTRKEYLVTCINSLLQQTMSEIEIILVDDGSISDCAKTCDQLAVKDERIIVIHQENQGVSVARNNGIKHSCGDWILFVDSDDWIEANSCEKLRNILKVCTYDMVMFRMIRESKKPCIMDYGLEFNKVYDLSFPYEREFLYHRVMSVPNAQAKILNPMYYSCDKVYRRKFLIDNNLFFPLGLAKSEDKVFISLCLEKATTFYHINEPLYHYRTNETSVCQRYSPNMDNHRILLTKELSPIAERMNKELSILLKDSTYHKILDDYERFMFGTITDVLYLKFYHKDNPNKKSRRKDAIKFLKTEPFKTIINKIPYNSLSNKSKMKKAFLKYGLVSEYCYLSRKLRK